MNWSDDLEFLILRVSHNFLLRSLVKKFYTKNSFQVYNKKPYRREGPADVAITKCPYVPSTSNVGGTNFCVFGSCEKYQIYTLEAQKWKAKKLCRTKYQNKRMRLKVSNGQ